MIISKINYESKNKKLNVVKGVVALKEEFAKSQSKLKKISKKSKKSRSNNDKTDKGG